MYVHHGTSIASWLAKPIDHRPLHEYISSIYLSYTGLNHYYYTITISVALPATLGECKAPLLLLLPTGFRGSPLILAAGPL